MPGTALLLSTCANHLIACPTLKPQLHEVMGNRLHIKNREGGASVEPFPSLGIEGLGAIRTPVQEVVRKQAHDRKNLVLLWIVRFCTQTFKAYKRGRNDKRAKIIALREV